MSEGWICDRGMAAIDSWMSDAPWLEANERTGHRYLVRHLHGVSACSHDAKEPSPPVAGACFEGLERFRRSDLLRQVFYGDPWTHPGEMTGFAPRYATFDAGRALSAVNVVDGNTCLSVTDGDLSSMWAVVWGPRTIYMVTPDGLPPVNHGEAALVVADWRYASRVANIASSTSADELERLLCLALMRLPSATGDNMRATIYVPPRIRDVLPNLNSSGYFRGVFVRAVEELAAPEARLERVKNAA